MVTSLVLISILIVYLILLWITDRIELFEEIMNFITLCLIMVGMVFLFYILVYVSFFTLNN